MFGGEHGDSAMQVGNKTKMACTIWLGDLNLTPEQSKKMNAVMAEHMKTGCTEASEAKYMQEAKAILTPEQYAKIRSGMPLAPRTDRLRFNLVMS